MKQETVESLVEKVLIKDKEAREDDHVLYIDLIYMINPALVNINFNDTFRNARINGLPPFESVSRARRKIQSENKDLRGSERNQIARVEKQIEFEEFYRRWDIWV